MIKMKQLLKEFTSMDFKVDPEENASKVGSILNKTGFRGLAPDKKVLARIKSFEGGKMFIHVQYHVVETKLGQFKLHQRQLYLRDKEVNVTQVYVGMLTEPYEEGYSMKMKDVGVVYVDTKKFLAALKRVNVIGGAS